MVDIGPYTCLELPMLGTGARHPNSAVIISKHVSFERLQAFRAQRQRVVKLLFQI
jgi:hypothetical protein